MIEALAWGAPVIARLCGSVPEILRHGITGLIGSSLDELVAAVGKIGELSRQTCRQEFEARFTAEVMAANYEDVYYQLADSDWSLRRHQSTARSKRPAWRRSAGPLRGAPMAPGRQPRSVEVRL